MYPTIFYTAWQYFRAGPFERSALDSMRVADAAFQSCRSWGPDTGHLLDALLETLLQVRRSGTLVVEVPGTWAYISTHVEAKVPQAAVVDHGPLSRLPQKSQQLLALIELGAADLRRLWPSRSQMIRSLGYALHPLPSLVWSSDKFDPEDYMFCFRIAAFNWSELSPELRHAFCDVVGLGQSRAEMLVRQPGFAIEMYGPRRQMYGHSRKGGLLERLLRLAFTVSQR